MILDEIVEDKKKRLPGHMARIRKQKCGAWQRGNKDEGGRLFL